MSQRIDWKTFAEKNVEVFQWKLKCQKIWQLSVMKTLKYIYIYIYIYTSVFHIDVGESSSV